ncbi:alginate export family protein [Caulobacter hibisci]|uniref:Alginate export family protein n=1 Tax=Caulobacter hibisci TaxID=2035993 RepID=A0ABS0T2I6_9CAUL|nr:alginate export family protein [Caulobacter hibisci]MBI1685696.1 alginate export family protein [Caulobacter hibisci]
MRTLAAAALVLAVPPGAALAAERPAIKVNRWQEDWSVLADPARRTEPLDGLKYVPLGPDAHLSLGLTLRERLELGDAPTFGEDAPDTSLSQRLQVHADARLGQGWRAFVMLEDVRAIGRRHVGGADADRLDLRLAFVDHVGELAGGKVTVRVGRQDFPIDQQRFLSARDGPGVRQSFDAVWADWSRGPWTLAAFASQPVQYADDEAFDDTSSGHVRLDLARVERKVFGGAVSAYAGRLDRSSARYGDAVGQEDRQVYDLRYVGKTKSLDWDLEAMAQRGEVGSADVRAWAAGARGGWTFESVPWTPRLGLQGDLASGDRRRGDGRLGTFNPLYPNAAYFTRAGYTGYANIVHLKPSVTVEPTSKLTVMVALAGQWRRTTADAIYGQPFVAYAGTAGQGGRWTGAYAHLRADYVVGPSLTATVEAVHFEAGGALRASGRDDSDYLGLELKYGW